jgi:hypothetical protein
MNRRKKLYSFKANLHKKLIIALLPIILLFAVSCGSVHRLTRVKTIPIDHSVNFGDEPVMTRRTELNRQPWVVFSDREQSQTNTTAGGRIRAREVDFLDPFLVIGSRGEHLRLIRYTPDILDNGRLDFRNAEYYGWIHRSHLLLNRQSVINMQDGRVSRMLTTFGDAVLIDEPERFIAEGAIKLFRDLELTSQAGVIPPHSIVYPLKRSPAGSAVLIAATPDINPDAPADNILGWICSSLIKNIGTRLHVNLPTLPIRKRYFLVNQREEVFLTDNLLQANELLSRQYASLRYAPVFSYSVRDSLAAFRTHLPVPVFDHSRNFIFNVDGNQISYAELGRITDELQRINISFVFDGTEHTINQFPQIVNALQNLQPLFEQPDDRFVYQFNTVMTFDANGTRNSPLSTNFTSDFAQVVNFLSDKAAQRENLEAEQTPQTSWAALQRAVANFDRHRNAVNLIVLIGDRRGANLELSEAFMSRIHRNNCRIIGFQVYAGEGNDYNNFILDIHQMIRTYADEMKESRRAILVSPEQIRRENQFTPTGENDNGFRLDFPDNSITQGALFFPSKGEYLSLGVLINSVDSIIGEIRQDNDAVAGHLRQAFRMTGNNRTVFDSLFVKNRQLNANETPSRSLLGKFADETPGWYMPSGIIVINNTENDEMGYRLLLSELEMNELREFIASLSEMEVDFIEDRAARRQNRNRRRCCCTDGDLFDELTRISRASLTYVPDAAAEGEEIAVAPPPRGDFANTRPVRRHLQRTLRDAVREQNRLCRQQSNNRHRPLTLAEAQRRIIGAPTATPFLHTIRIRDLRNRRLVTDEMLDGLITYYKEMAEKLDKAQEFESNGRRYFWVDREWLP